MIDLEAIRESAQKATNEFLRTRLSSSWQKLSPTLYAKRDGAGLNLWLRGDHAGGEGLFFVPEYELPALSVIFNVLSAEHVEKFKAQYQPALPEQDFRALRDEERERKRLEKPGKAKNAE